MLISPKTEISEFFDKLEESVDDPVARDAIEQFEHLDGRNIRKARQGWIIRCLEGLIHFLVALYLQRMNRPASR